MHSKTFKEKYEQLSKFSEIILRGPYVVSRGLYLFRFSSIHHHFLLPTRISVAWCSQDFQGRRSANFFLPKNTYISSSNFKFWHFDCIVLCSRQKFISIGASVKEGKKTIRWKVKNGRQQQSTLFSHQAWKSNPNFKALKIYQQISIKLSSEITAAERSSTNLDVDHTVKVLSH